MKKINIHQIRKKNRKKPCTQSKFVNRKEVELRLGKILHG